MVTVLSDYTVIVQTADKFGAGTAATVKIKVEGTKGNAERNLEGSFGRGEYGKCFLYFLRYRF